MEQFKWAKILILSLGCIIFSSLTLKEILPLFNAYHNHNEAVEMGVTTQNEAIQPPLVSLCIPRSNSSLMSIATQLRSSEKNQSLCPECKALANHSWDVWKNFDFATIEQLSDLEFYNLLSEALSKKLLIDNAEDDFAVLDVENLYWNMPLVDAAWDLLNCITYHDSKKNYLTWSRCDGKHDIDLALSVSKLGILHDRIIAVLCKFAKFGSSPDSCQNNFELISLSLIRSNAYCMVTNLQKRFSFSFGSIAKGIQWPAMFDPINVFEVYEGIPIKSYTSNIYFSDNTPLLNYAETVSLQYSVISTVVEKRQRYLSNCFNDSSFGMCILNCMLQNVFQQCNCIPFTVRKLIPQTSYYLPYCNSTIYFLCATKMSVEHGNCESKCDNPCQYTLYRWQVTKWFNSVSNKYFSLEITPVKTQIVQFATVDKYSQQQFFSQVAAVFNLYLGLSGLGLVSVLLFCIEYLQKWYLKWKASNNRMDASDVSASQQANSAGNSAPVVASGIDLETKMREVINSMATMQEKFETMEKRMAKLEKQVRNAILRKVAHQADSISEV